MHTILESDGFAHFWEVADIRPQIKPRKIPD